MFTFVKSYQLGPDASKRILQLDSQQAMGAAACLIKYLDLLADEGLHGKFRLREMALDGYMKLDRAAVRALNLFPQPQEGNRNMSLYSLLNKVALLKKSAICALYVTKISRELTCGYFYQCKTPIGSRLLLRWIKQPLVDKSEIEARLDLVGLLMEQVQVRQALQVYIYAHTHQRAARRPSAWSPRATRVTFVGGNFTRTQHEFFCGQTWHLVPLRGNVRSTFCSFLSFFFFFETPRNRVHSVHRVLGLYLPGFVLVACRVFWREKEKTRERKKAS